MSRPLVGISTYREDAAWGVWHQRADLLPTTYADAVSAVGGVPMLLPPSSTDLAADVVARLDALVVAGGADVAPAAYGEAAGPETGPPRHDRDAWEFALLDAATARSLPTLGVCRGMQVMAVHAGGVLDQHVPDLVGHDRHSPGADAFGDVKVQVAADSAIGRLLATDHVQVSCHHHQAVRTHPGFTAVAWADDGTVEAMEQPGRFCLGVQWHPEVVADVGLFRGLVAEAERCGAAREVISSGPSEA